MNVIDKVRPAEAIMFSLDWRRTLIRSDAEFDDMVVLFGLVAKGHIAPDTLRRELRKVDQDKSGAELIEPMLASGIIDRGEWAAMYQLWYRWKIPLGAASLVWWRLYCIALGRASTPQGALDLFEEWLDRIEAPGNASERLRTYEECSGLTASGGIAVVRNDIDALDSLAAATLKSMPLLSLRHPAEIAQLEEVGIRIAVSDVDQEHVRSSHLDSLLGGRTPLLARSLVELCGGRDPKVGGLATEMRRSWSDLPAEDRTMILITLEQRMSALEQVRISYGGTAIENDGIVEILAGCRGTTPDSWTPLQLRVASLVWIWQEAGFVLQELNQAETSLPTLAVFLERRTADYEKVCHERLSPGPNLIEFARSFSKLRGAVEKAYLRCLYFDGGNWERREFLVARSDCEAQLALPPELPRALEKRFGLVFPEGKYDRALKCYLGDVLEAGFTPSDLVIALADWSANCSDLPADYAIFTAPLGVNLERPWEMSIEEVFCYTAIKDGFDPKSSGVPLGFVGIRNTIGQRMRYNVVKKAQNYALVKRLKPQSFNLPDISVAEDAHQGGHTASGVRFACRIPTTINYHGSEWKGIADVRLNRADYRDEHRFSERELMVATRYGAWLKAIADETFARGLQFDPAYCVNLDDGRNISAKLGERP